MKFDLTTLNNFKSHEFPSEVELYCDSRLFPMLDEFRDAIASPVYPSPRQGAWYRFSGSKTSQHYAVNRYSTAGDVFIECSPFFAMLKAIEIGFRGIGIYYDKKLNGKPKVMLHLDLRDDLVIWVQDENGDRETICPRPNINIQLSGVSDE